MTGKLALDQNSKTSPYSQVLLSISTDGCKSSQDFQNAKITFATPSKIATPTASFWFDQSNPLPFSYPSSPTNITSSGGTSTINLTFPSNGNSIVKHGQKFTIIFGISNEQLNNTSVQVDISGGQTQTGTLTIVTNSPSNLPNDAPLPVVNLSATESITCSWGKSVSQTLRDATWRCATTQTISVPLVVTGMCNNSSTITFADVSNPQNTISVQSSATSVPLYPGHQYSITATNIDGLTTNINPKPPIDPANVSKITINYITSGLCILKKSS